MNKFTDWWSDNIWGVLIVILAICAGITGFLSAMKFAGWIGLSWTIVTSFIWIPASIIIGIWITFIIAILAYMLATGGG